ncbi:MAG: hypothetical protein LBH18_02935 [Spirochaetaceae bacterium]|jgi:hypothetical protein|nr:hypothetical protein [Spirochaetaceae bacterium]
MSDLESIFDVDNDIKDTEQPDVQAVENSSGFPTVEKLFEDTGHKIFENPVYYKMALADEGDATQRLHTLFQKYATTKDPKDKSIFRMQLISVFWDFIGRTAQKMTAGTPEPKRYMLRFGILHPNMLTAEAKAFLSKIPVKDELGQPVYYLDEWISMVGAGKMKCSTTDEAGPSSPRGNMNAHLQSLYDKAQGKIEGAQGLLRSKHAERLTFEKQLSNSISRVMNHAQYDSFPEVFELYTDEQKQAFSEIQEQAKALLKIDRESASYMKDLESASEDLQTINGKLEEAGSEKKVSMDLQSINTEFSSVRQMAKMTVGRQGNAFPILTSEFFRPTPIGVGFRENIIKQLSWVESIDSEAFIRHYKNKPNRIVPYVLLLPTYGDFGMCWEPFDKSNRATSRGRIAIPMYPKNLTLAVLSAVGDLRWQVAKEKASFYWMEEGLTGNYYQWFQAQKLKGDVKAYFIQDYIMWMTKESEGTQKLDKDVRGTFWRYVPFTQAVKEKLKDRNLIYQELYQRDKNRAMSDGY